MVYPYLMPMPIPILTFVQCCCICTFGVSNLLLVPTTLKILLLQKSRIQILVHGLLPNGWDTKSAIRISHNCPWKFISQGLPSFCSLLSFRLGDGSRIKFWKIFGLATPPPFLLPFLGFFAYPPCTMPLFVNFFLTMTSLGTSILFET